MKQVLLLICSLLCMALLVGCDPTLPIENIQAVVTPSVILQGETAEIEIVYPDFSNTSVTEWINQKVTIVSGGNFIEVNEMTITGISLGVAIIRVEVTARSEKWFLWFTDEYQFSVDIEVKVVEE